MNPDHLKFICFELDLGVPEGSPVRIGGGRGGHLMWRVGTNKGHYAIKQLAPCFDLNDQKVVTKYELSETIASLFSHRGIPAVPAMEKLGRHLIITNGAGYLVYPWIEGATLGRNEVSEKHALTMAQITAQIHGINLQVPGIAAQRFDIYKNNDVLEKFEKILAMNSPVAKSLKENQSLILAMNDRYLAAIPVLKESSVVTHGDLDQLNVLWDKSNNPHLIDWESVRKMNPTREAIRTCLSWSGIGSDSSSMPLYKQMLQVYLKSGGLLNKNHVEASLCAVFGSMLNWLLYNVEIVYTASDAEEKNTAIQEMQGTLAGFKRLVEIFPDLLEAL